MLAAYAAALVAVPSDVGPRILGLVLSPSRAILAALFIFLLVGGSISARSVGRLPRSVLGGWVLFLGCAAVSTILQPTPSAVARYGSMVAEGLVLFVVVTVVVRNATDVTRIVATLAVATIAVAALTLILNWLGGSYDDIFGGLSRTGPSSSALSTRFGVVRQPGSFPAPLFLGVWLAAASVLVLPFLRAARRPRAVALLGGWALLFVAIVLLTVSRMAITSTLLLAGAYFLVRKRRWVGVMAVAASVAVAIGLASVTWGIPGRGDAAIPQESVFDRGPAGSIVPSSRPASMAPSDVDVIAESNALRMEAFAAAVKAVSFRPLFGWGLLTEKEVVSKIGGKTNFVDSSYLALLVDLGLAGFSAFLFLLIALASAARAARTSALGLALILATLAVLGMSGLAAFLAITQGYALTWLLAGLLLSVALQRDRVGMAGR